MKAVIVYGTYDGQWFESVEEARKHLDAEAANILSYLASKVCACKKYSQACDFVGDPATMDLYLKLHTIRKDRMAVRKECDAADDEPRVELF